MQVLRHAITLSPEDGYEKYLYLAQLIEGQEAITLTRKGVALVAQQADAAKAPGSQVPEEEQKILCQAYSGALCSLAELILNEADDLATVSAEVQGLLGQVCKCAGLLRR